MVTVNAGGFDVGGGWLPPSPPLGGLPVEGEKTQPADHRRIAPAVIDGTNPVAAANSWKGCSCRFLGAGDMFGSVFAVKCHPFALSVDPHASRSDPAFAGFSAVSMLLTSVSPRIVRAWHDSWRRGCEAVVAVL